MGAIHWAVMAATLFVLLVLATLLVQGFMEPYRLIIEKIEGPLPGLPKSWEGTRVVLLADFQVGLWLDNRATVRRAVARTVALRPAFVLLAGDLIHDTERGIAPVVELLRPLKRVGIPTYAVLGNHDYAMPTANYPENRPLAEGLEAALAEIGIPVLHNESVALRNEHGDTLYLVGIGSHVPKDDDPVAALSGVPEGAPRLVMMHHPNSYPSLPAHSAPLAVAAHTHGGQVRLPLAPAWSLLTWVRERKVYNSDWARGYGREGNRLYVTRGIGCSVAPIRLNCPPELTLITLRRPEAADGAPD
jgi:predicted MPP superfamily phosphohydrolase